MQRYQIPVPHVAVKYLRNLLMSVKSACRMCCAHLGKAQKLAGTDIYISYVLRTYSGMCCAHNLIWYGLHTYSGMCCTHILVCAVHIFWYVLHTYSGMCCAHILVCCAHILVCCAHILVCAAHIVTYYCKCCADILVCEALPGVLGKKAIYFRGTKI